MQRVIRAIEQSSRLGEYDKEKPNREKHRSVASGLLVCLLFTVTRGIVNGREFLSTQWNKFPRPARGSRNVRKFVPTDLC